MAGNWRHGICFFGTGELVAARKYDTMYPNTRRGPGQSRRALARQCPGSNKGADLIHRLWRRRAIDGGMHARYWRRNGFRDAGEVAVKSAMRQSKRGMTLVELVIAMMVLVILSAIAIPAFQALLQRSQLDAAVRQIMSDVREVQSRATLTSWQYQLVGYENDSGSPYKNQYRVIGRSSSAVAWPVDTVATFNFPTPAAGATQMAGNWVDVNKLYPDVKLDTADATTRFWVSYDSRGAAFQINSFPLNLSHKSGQKQCLGVTAAGSIRMVKIGSVGCP